MLSKDLFQQLTNIKQLTTEQIISLTDKGLLKENKLTAKALKLLEPYKVKRAIIIAAGFGSRLVPVTLKHPKPLVKVNGKLIIETLLDALVKADIQEIYIVRGYKKEQFDTLLTKYPFIKFIDNNNYNATNNISSVYLARNLIDNAYICEADLYVSNSNIIEKYQYESNYLGIKVNHTDDWAFEVSDDVIKEVKIGADNCYQMVGISFWTKEDGEKLATDLTDMYVEKKGKNYYWDETPLKYYKENYCVHVRKCLKEDIVEIDTFDELKEIDPTYNNYN